MGKSVIRFFSSVKLAIVLIILLVAASIVGTLIPQGRDMAEYAARYGRMGKPLVGLQLTDVYRSAWFLGLLGLFGLNIAACTATRLGGKVRRARRPRIESDAKTPAAGAIRDEARMRLKEPPGYGEAGDGGPGRALEEAVAAAEAALRSNRYKVLISRMGADGDEGKADGRTGRLGRAVIFGRKRVDGLFGSDIVHLGLLVIIAGGIITSIGGLRADLALRLDQAVDVPEAGFCVRLDRFETEFYPNGSVKDWKSTLAVIENGREQRRQVVEVNHPLVYRGYSFYQNAYGYDWDQPTLKLWIAESTERGANAAVGAIGAAADAAGRGEASKDNPGDDGDTADIDVADDVGTAGKSTEKTAGRMILVRTGEKSALNDAEGTEILVRRFLPDFVIGQNGVPSTRSDQPNNPSALVEAWRGGRKIVEGWVFAAYPDISRLKGEAAENWRIEIRDLDAPQYSVIQAARDPGVPFIWLGCLLVMAGLVLAFYRPTWEIRMTAEESADGKTAVITAGGIAVKSRDRFAAEFARVMYTLKNQ